MTYGMYGFLQGASFAIGNAVFHSSALVSKLSGSIPLLKALLSDQAAKIRSHAAGMHPSRYDIP